MNKEWNFRQIQNYIYEGPLITLSASPYFPHWRFVTMMLVGSASVPYKWSQTFKFVFCTSSHFRTVWKRKGRLSSVCSCIENGYVQIRCPEGRGTLSAWSPGSYLVTKWCSKVVCIVIIWYSYAKWCPLGFNTCSCVGRGQKSVLNRWPPLPSVHLGHQMSLFVLSLLTPPSNRTECLWSV